MLLSWPSTVVRTLDTVVWALVKGVSEVMGAATAEPMDSRSVAIENFMLDLVFL